MKPEEIINAVINPKIQAREKHIGLLEERYGDYEVVPEEHFKRFTEITRELDLLIEIKKELQKKFKENRS